MHALCAWFNDYYRDRIQQGSDNTRKTGQSGGPRINGSRLYIVSIELKTWYDLTIEPQFSQVCYFVIQEVWAYGQYCLPKVSDGF